VSSTPWREPDTRFALNTSGEPKAPFGFAIP
jgi:hypothetical protein